MVTGEGSLGIWLLPLLGLPFSPPPRQQWFLTTSLADAIPSEPPSPLHWCSLVSSLTSSKPQIPLFECFLESGKQITTPSLVCPCPE